jgi:hypothetical protein
VLYLSSSIAPLLPYFYRVIHSLFSFCRDDEEPPKDATAAPSTSLVTADKPVEQEVAPRVTRASVKKIPVTRNLKRSKKAKETDVVLEAMHQRFLPVT